MTLFPLYSEIFDYSLKVKTGDDTMYISCGNLRGKLVAILLKQSLESGNLVAKICGNSGKKWQEIELLCAELWKNREIPGRNFNLQRDH
jgi:hypothetical protein